MPRPLRLLVVAVVAGLVAAALPHGGVSAAEEIRESGYITVRDGTRLHYTYVRPAGDAKVPTLLTYDGYDAGFNPDPGYIERYVPKGYAFIGVSLRGSGCSGGTWDFFQPAEALDGYDVIEWIAQQPWSDGKVAMVGKSYPGITQLFVAQQRPPHLVAIAPGHTYGDIYRDIAYPGGILNYGFSSLWSFVAQPYPSYSAALQRTAAGDPTCAQHLAQRPASVRYNPFLQAQEHQWDDELIRERSPIYGIERINVPTWTLLAWQDEQVGPKSVDWIPKIKAPVHAIVTNGDHGMYRTKPALAELDAFFDHYVKGIDNGFDDRPRIQVWWEAGRDGSRAPGWVTALDTWPATKKARKLYLDNDGALSTKRPSSGGADSFVYAGPTGQGIENPRYGYPDLPDEQFWGRRPDGPSVTYTTPPLKDDLAALGSASADLWMSSTAPDTDVQVTLTEVRPDGQETFVQQGWLRASHRALDPVRSTKTRPVHTHQQRDQHFLTPGMPVKLRVEVFPFGHVFRAGSQLRLYVESPKPLPDLWSFVALPVPAVNTALHDAAHRSALVLPVVDAKVPESARALPECGSVIRQPCRSAG